MNDNILDEKTVAILVADGFDQCKLEAARAALVDAKARTYVVSPKGDAVERDGKKSVR